MKLVWLCLMLFLFFVPKTKALVLSPDANISLLTCETGDEIYSYFGHSAVRINDPKAGVDYVFNYGVFSFDTPNFAWRFMKGETDYMIAGQRMNSFLEAYVEENRTVYEQILDLTLIEKQALFDALLENSKVENRLYRYRHFSDNCSTRVRDQFEKCVNHTLRYDTSKDPKLTYRQLIDQCVPVDSWDGFGIKIALGMPADQQTTFAQKMFLPIYLLNSMARATVERDGVKKSFAQPKTILYKSTSKEKGFDFTSPVVFFMALFILILGLTALEVYRKSRFVWLDFMLFLLLGGCGLLLSFLCFVSLLEATGSNLNLIWALPTHFVFAILWLFKSLRPRLLGYLKFTFFSSASFLALMAFLPQTFHWLVIPICLMIILRSGSALLYQDHIVV
jgi:Domain of unknown function (DUF4105)